ncbi:MAG TPA: 4-alpha-glucanotransferase [Candidatus Binataceae bacterium]|nr:4-alpha-glucanotransferase [Candidatus Binataceae bacterium]
MPTKSAGVLVPLFSLRTRDDLGRGEIMDLAAMADFARAGGLGIIQLLPLDEGGPGETSPYSAMSVLAIDPVYISASNLGRLGRRALARARAEIGAGRIVARSRYRPVKLAMLERAFAASRKRGGAEFGDDFDRFSDRNRDWLGDYALFRALKERFKWTPWDAWPRELAGRDPLAIAVARRELAGPIAMYSWWQFVADRQWSAARAYAHRRGVLLGGDMAFSPARDSAEVWANQPTFDLGRTVGAPPDAFNQHGQRWGLPMPRWQAMRADGFRLWRTRARRAGAMFDLLRIDHVVGIYRTFSFGADPDADGAFSPSDEHAQVAQGEEIMRALREAAGACDLIAEDLGSVPDWVRDSLTRLGIPGYKVMQWEREGWGGPDERFRSPSTYPELSLATTGTHDTEALTVWWREQPIHERDKLCAALGIAARINPRRDRLGDDARDAIIEALYAAPSRYVTLPIQDLFGWSARVNRPGTVSDSNWTYRLPLTIDRLAAHAGVQTRLARLRAIAQRTGRLPSGGDGGESP